ncbi:MAG TPA: hypothetical protein VE866_05575 [Candidatus Binatia bacterium]|nr:hypothetical protein [Candidatus Binatia bacterium]
MEFVEDPSDLERGAGEAELAFVAAGHCRVDVTEQRIAHREAQPDDLAFWRGYFR